MICLNRTQKTLSESDAEDILGKLIANGCIIQVTYYEKTTEVGVVKYDDTGRNTLLRTHASATGNDPIPALQKAYENLVRTYSFLA